MVSHGHHFITLLRWRHKMKQYFFLLLQISGCLMRSKIKHLIIVKALNLFLVMIYDTWTAFFFTEFYERLFTNWRTKEEVERQHQGMDRPGVRQVQERSGEQGKMEKSGCKIVCGAPTTLAVKGLMMMYTARTPPSLLTPSVRTESVQTLSSLWILPGEKWVFGAYAMTVTLG